MLKLGISFYTFQAMSYTIDFYRGTIKREPSFIRFATFVSLFPQLVAGQIERAKNLLPQLTGKPDISMDYDASQCRSSYRYNEAPGYTDICFGYDIYGFRCVKNV